MTDARDRSSSHASSANRQQQFQTLVDAHYRSVWQYVATLTRGAAEAEDLTHQAFLLAFDRMVEERPIEDAGLWLRGVVRNLVREWWPHRRWQRRFCWTCADAHPL